MKPCSVEWKQKRAAAFKRELQKRLEKKIGKANAAKVVNATPKLIRYLEVGALDDQDFREALVEEYGGGVADQAVIKRLKDLSDEAQKQPDGVRRDRVYEKMGRILDDSKNLNVWDAIRNGDWWFASVLMRFGTFTNVVSGSFLTAAAWEAMKALDTGLVQGKPMMALRQIGLFTAGVLDAARAIGDIVGKGNYSALLDAKRRNLDLLNGKKGADVLEALKRRGNPVGVLAYTRRIMAYLDYLAAQGTRDSSALYAALARGDQDSVKAIGRRWETGVAADAEKQARAEIPDGTETEIRKRKREILEEGVNEEVLAGAVNLARRVAQNADPQGLAGMIYSAFKPFPLWIKAPAGLAFLRAALNTVSNAADFIPGIGIATLYRSSDRFKSKVKESGLHVLGLELTPEERRIAFSSQLVGLGVTIGLLGWAASDDPDDDEGMEISGGWRNLTPQQAKELRALGQQPYAIRLPGSDKWISYKQSPLAPVLASVGAVRDQRRFDREKWKELDSVNKAIYLWSSGLLFVKDISSLGQLAHVIGARAGAAEEYSIGQANEALSRALGRGLGGFVPSILTEIEDYMDPTVRAPLKDEAMGQWLRNFPVANYANKPALNFLGDPVTQTRPPLRGILTEEKDGPVYEFVGKWAGQGLFVRQAAQGAKVFDPTQGKMREMNPQEFYQYQAAFGTKLKEVLTQVIPNLQEPTRKTVEEVYRKTGDAVAKYARGVVQAEIIKRGTANGPQK